MNISKGFLISILLLLGITQANAQLSYCSNDVPYYYVDLTGSPDSAWAGNYESRDGSCCGSKNNETCVSYTLLLDSSAQGIVFDVLVGGAPNGSLFWKLGCPAQEFSIGVPICLPGPGPYELTLCKPGNNPNQYGIRSIAKPEASPPTVVSDGCSAQIFAKNLLFDFVA